MQKYMEIPIIFHLRLKSLYHTHEITNERNRFFPWPNVGHAVNAGEKCAVYSKKESIRSLFYCI